jgi:phospholipase/carboxylesterase
MLRPLDVELYPASLDRADYAMIGLHGRNANKHAFFPFVRQMGFLHTRWILPSAPFAAASAPEVRWWFDRESDNLDEITGSRAAITQLIDTQIASGIPAENIFITGFSQGSVMALDTALRYPVRLGGVVALSGYLAHPERLATERHLANARIPVFLAHGTGDTTLTIDVGRNAAAVLHGLGYEVEFHEYAAGHRISTGELRDIRAFLHRHMYGIQIDDPRMRDSHIVQF